MREIKFRAWNGADYMTKPFTLLDIQNGNIRFASSDTVIMQYTGLKDKNGKEIYEGDILRHNGLVEKVVKYNTERAQFEMRFPTGGGFIDGVEYFTDRGGEVVGNIYEKPELLSTSKQLVNDNEK